MSFSFNTSAAPDEIVEEVRRLGAENVERMAQHGAAHQQAAIESIGVAVDAITAFVAQLGDDYPVVAVTVSGHANDDHQPSTSWADDCLTISINARSARNL